MTRSKHNSFHASQDHPNRLSAFLKEHPDSKELLNEVKETSLNKVAKKYDVSTSTIIKWLGKEYKAGSLKRNSFKPVKCMDDNIEFESTIEAGRQYKVDSTTIANAIKTRNGYVPKIKKTFEFVKK